jgi:hypothetical protein
MSDGSERLLRPFLRLWAADALSTAGDGVTMVAARLLLTTPGSTRFARCSWLAWLYRS